MAARLQGNVEGCATGLLSRLIESDHLGMGLARWLGRSPAYDNPLPDQDCADGRVGAGASQRLPCQVNGLAHEGHLEAVSHPFALTLPQWERERLRAGKLLGEAAGRRFGLSLVLAAQPVRAVEAVGGGGQTQV